MKYKISLCPEQQQNIMSYIEYIIICSIVLISQIVKDQNIYNNSNSKKNSTTMSSQQNGKDRTNGRWTKQEHQKFLQGLQMFGKNWKKIQTLIGTRNGSQIRSHAQKFFLKLGVKSSEPEESLENHDPSSPSMDNSKKQNRHQHTALQISSSFFWRNITKLAKNPAFTIWNLIDYVPDPQSKETSQIEEEEKKQAGQQTLVERIQPFVKNQNNGFNIFCQMEEI